MACRSGADGAPSSYDAGPGAEEISRSDATSGASGQSSGSETFVGLDGSGDKDGQGAAPCLPAMPDADHDGFTVAQGDCNDCDPNVNPGAYDVPANGIDEDCDGAPDDEPAACDMGLAVDASDATKAALSLDICRSQKGSSWGLVKAAWVFPDGTTGSLPEVSCPTGGPPNPLSHGLLPSFGPNVAPRSGDSMVAISSGVARPGTNLVPAPGTGTSPQSGSMCTYTATPPGFPKSEPSCPGVEASTDTHVYDGMALELTIKVPTNAYALDFDFDFYTTEFPYAVCSPDGYDDQFVALLWSGVPGLPADHNISFDALGDPVSVNNAFLAVCQPTTADGRMFTCPLGPGALAGTGMDMRGDWPDGSTFVEGGATGWLTTRSGVLPGETVKLRFGIWDSIDANFDSTTLIDHFRWELSSGQNLTPVAPVTERPPR